MPLPAPSGWTSTYERFGPSWGPGGGEYYPTHDNWRDRRATQSLAARKRREQQQQQMNPMQQLLTSYQSAYGSARAANEKRYQDILSGMEGMGQQEAADINAQWQGAEGRGMQGLASAGLSGTTIAPTLRASYARNRTADLGRLQDRLKQMRFGFMERREDEYPDFNQLIGLAQGMGQAGYGANWGAMGQAAFGGGGGSTAYGVRGR